MDRVESYAFQVSDIQSKLITVSLSRHRPPNHSAETPVGFTVLRTTGPVLLGGKVSKAFNRNFSSIFKSFEKVEMKNVETFQFR